MEALAPVVKTRRTARQERIEVRVTAEHKRLIEEAAEVSGRSLTAFVLDAACQRAEHVINERERLVLSNRERDRLLAALENPPAPNEALLRAARRNADLLR